MRHRFVVVTFCCCLPLLAMATPAEARIGGGHSYGHRSRGGRSGHHASHGKGTSSSADATRGSSHRSGNRSSHDDPYWTAELTMLVAAVLCMVLFWVLARVLEWREDALLYEPRSRRSLKLSSSDPPKPPTA